MRGGGDNLYLTGFMGSGKSAAARALHALCGMPLLEMDEEIAAEEGMSIPKIFRVRGEQYFRGLETAFLERMKERSGTIVSCGGGVPLRPENVERMRQTGRIVLLQASPETILERVIHDNGRPLLADRKTPEGIRTLLEERRPAYEAAASLVIDTDGKSVQEVCREIMTELGLRQA